MAKAIFDEHMPQPNQRGVLREDVTVYVANLPLDLSEAEAERIAREEWQLPTMRMTVIDIRDELIAFYERRGYGRTGIKKPFPYGDERYGIPKRKDLRFEILEKPLTGAAA